MATEKRLIDANALMEQLEDRQAFLVKEWGYRDHYTRGFEEAVDKVGNAPVVDAVEVVRCKDCKEWCRNAGIVDSPNGHCFCHDIDTNQFDFCSYGERKDNGC